MLNWIKRLFNRRGALLAAGIAIVLVLAGLLVYVVRLNRHISAEQEAAAAAQKITVEETRLRPPVTDGLTVYLNAADARATAVFAGTRYLATSGGLIAL